MGGTGVIDQFLETFTRYIDTGFGLVGGEVGYSRPRLWPSTSRWQALFGCGAG